MDILRKLAYLLLCFLMISKPATAENIGEQTVFVSTSERFIYSTLFSQPDLNADITGNYYSGTEISILSWIDKEWVYVRIGNGGTQEGYMLSQYLTESKDFESDIRPKYESDSSAWDLYSSPDLASSTATYGLERDIILIGFTDKWWHIQIGEQTGFVPSFPAYFNQVSGTYYDGFSVAYVCNSDASDRLHLRKKASVRSDSLGKYYNGTIVAVISDEAGEWKKVRIGNLDGYMKAEYLSNDFSAYTDALPICVISNRSGTGLNLRANQGTSSKSLGLFTNGTSVTVLGLTDSWCHVSVDGKVGFMLLSGFGNQISYSKYSTVASTTRVAEITATCSLYRTTSPDDDDVMTTLEPGTEVKVLQTGSQWYKVKFNNLEGYVAASVVKLK